MTESYEAIIGLEIHAELNTRTKMFCGCLNDPRERHPNINICPVCMGHPGTLPVINDEAVKKIVSIGIALHGEISEFSQFDRKHYFYPDLPKGYQISQYMFPIVRGGYLEIPRHATRDKEQAPTRAIRLQRIHVEEDAGRLLHAHDESLVDYNRAGVPLMELVTEPDLRTAREARAFAEELRLTLRYVGVSDADMEKGEMRIEANVSIHAPDTPYGTKVEVKNINSFRAVEKAIEYEIARQEAVLAKGERVTQETRGWDDEKEITVSQRLKEEAREYRYFPEPDLPPLTLSFPIVSESAAHIPELPVAKRARFSSEFSLSPALTELLVADKGRAAFFEEAVSEFREQMPEGSAEDTGKGIQLLAHYLVTDLLRYMNELGAEYGDMRVTPHTFAELMTLLIQQAITTPAAKIVLQKMVETGAEPGAIVASEGLSATHDRGEIEKIADAVIFKYQKAAMDYKSGKEEALQYLIGQGMRELRGRVQPDTLREVFERKLKG